MESFSSLHAESFLHQKLRENVFITTDGLPLYRPLAASFDVCQIPINGGPKDVEIFSMCTGSSRGSKHGLEGLTAMYP
jgi:hypothetical protein